MNKDNRTNRVSIALLATSPARASNVRWDSED